MQDLILTTEHKRRIFMKQNNWNWCRQARWVSGERVELYSLYSGEHEIRVLGMGIDMSYTIPSYAGFTQYDKWVREVQEFVDGNWNEEKFEEMGVFVDNLELIKLFVDMTHKGEQK
jgi:hypothetical protein